MGSSAPKLLDGLPDEILLEICEWVDPHHRDRVLGHVPDDPPPNPPDLHIQEDFLKHSSNYCSLARVNKRFSRLVQEFLYRAPVLDREISPAGGDYSRCVLFLRTLFERQDLRRHVNYLRLYEDWVRVDHDPNEQWGAPSKPAMLVANLTKQACDMIQQSEIPQPLRSYWHEDVSKSLQMGLFGILMALLPCLEVIVVSNPKHGGLNSDYASGRHGERHGDLLLHVLPHYPISQTLKYLKTTDFGWANLAKYTLTPYITTFDLSIDLSTLLVDTPGNFELFNKHYSDGKFTTNHVRHLRLDCQTKVVGIWNQKAAQNVENYLGSFKNLTHLDFYAEPSIAKNPYQSVRAFPKYQANIQHWPDAPPLSDPTAEDQPWHQALYDARTQYTDYQHLVDVMRHLCATLEYVKLPGGFWTLPGGARKTVPRFASFERLSRLIVPQAAIISLKLDNMRPLDEAFGDFELSPSQALPEKLKQLKIFDADVSLLGSRWLNELFESHADHDMFKMLTRVEILFGYMVSDQELEDIVARKGFEQFWGMVNRAGFEVILGRDNEEPSVCMP